jgi:hypothetical protein
MKTYRLTKPSDYRGLFKVSLVDDPAIQVNLMAFDAEKPEFVFKDEEQRIIYAPALIPNKLIFRKEIEGEPANVYFDAEMIKELQIDYFRGSSIKHTNLNHQREDTSGIFSFENWITIDKEVDKSFKMGFDVPVGTMMMGYKIDNDEVWNEIKLGNLKGLSIEAQLFPEEIKEQVTLKNENMNKKGLLLMAFEAVKNAFKFADMVDYGGGYFGSSLEMGAIITDGEGNAMPDDSFEFDGSKYMTDELGAVMSIEPIEAAEVAEGDDMAAKDAKILELETKIADMEAAMNESGINNLEKDKDMVNMKSEFDAKIIKLESDLVESRKIPAVVPAAPKTYWEMNNHEQLLYNRLNKR